ncbi:MAG TPA: LytTR family transcriptional regulator DNA-binding domain-containing protein [Anaerovoracaceae bacterium]|nr:LytTR family transcriptional regulator DNA-binding domain-containing protein [Anaerovoracaceae bacterium]
MKKLRTIIIEDELPARELLKHYLKDYNEIEVIAECPDGFSGLKSISEMKPDLVFLDIQMPKLTGFEMLEVLEERPEIIFTTAYDEYAIKAFELNAVDYLLKPFHKERLKEAINKAIEKTGSGKTDQKSASRIISRVPDLSSPLSRVVVRKANSIQIIPVDQIRYVEAQDDYVMIYHSSGKALKQQTMKFYEDNLPKTDFIRIHRSYIVRVEEIKRIEPYGKDTHIAILQSDNRLPVSRAGYKHLKKELNF